MFLSASARTAFSSKAIGDVLSALSVDLSLTSAEVVVCRGGGTRDSDQSPTSTPHVRGAPVGAPRAGTRGERPRRIRAAREIVVWLAENSGTKRSARSLR